MKKTIAIVSHDSRKKEMIEWVEFNKDILSKHNLICTGTTGKLIEKTLDIPVTKKASGILGGDSQIAGMIADYQIDALFFFCDNLIVQGHLADIQTLTRLASLYNIAFATNRTTADMILTSPLFGSDAYKPIKNDFSTYLNRSI